MAIIRIVANGIELDFVRETLKIKKENNSFIPTFKVSYNSYPFLIVENSKTASALGTREITSVLKKKIVPVFVYEMGIPYYGELEIISYISGFRKCNLRFGSDIILHLLI